MVITVACPEDTPFSPPLGSAPKAHCALSAANNYDKVDYQVLFVQTMNNLPMNLLSGKRYLQNDWRLKDFGVSTDSTHRRQAFYMCNVIVNLPINQASTRERY